MAERPKCEARGCEALADWAYIGEGGEVYACASHGGTEPVYGWEWIGWEATAERDSSPPRDEDREPANSVQFGSNRRAES